MLSIDVRGSRPCVRPPMTSYSSRSDCSLDWLQYYFKTNHLPTGLKTVNVVRDRPGARDLHAELSALGADVVSTEEALKEDLASSQLPHPRLALNCVGGSSSAAIAKTLECDCFSRYFSVGSGCQLLALALTHCFRCKGHWTVSR